MSFRDDDLSHFAAHGASLPEGGSDAVVEHDGASIWSVSYGAGPPVVLLHGGMGHAGNFAHQIPALVAAGRQVFAIDSRGHGHSSRDSRPLSYEQIAGDVLAVMDARAIRTAALVGWSDGACTSLALARRAPERVSGVFFFACNVDPTGTKPFVMTSAIGHCIDRHRRDYEVLSPTPAAFDTLSADLQVMQREQPNYSADDLRSVSVPVTIAQSPDDEFIALAHAQYLARTIPGARLDLLDGVTHFAPLQRPGVFNAAVLRFLEQLG